MTGAPASITLRRHLAEQHLFGNLPDDHLDALSGCAREIILPPGSRVLREGDTADSCIVIRSGRVSLELHDPREGTQRLATVGPGQLLGWSWLYPPHRWQMDATAIDELDALELDAAALRSLIEDDPRFGYELLLRLIQMSVDRLTGTRLQLLDMYAPTGRPVQPSTPPAPGRATHPPAPEPAGPMVPTRYRVLENRTELADTVTLTLEPVDSPIGPWRPGQFTMLWVPGVGEVPISVSGDPADARVPGAPLVHTIRSVGAVTEALCHLHPGAMVGVRGPFGSDWGVDDPDLEGRHLVLVAGGLGLAPMRSAVHAALADRSRFASVTLLVGARAPDQLLFGDDLRRWAAAADLELFVTVDRDAPGWTGDVGVVTTLLPRLGGDPARTTALICGPEIMMRFTAAGLVDQGVEARHIRLSMERNMRCAVAMCGHCQFGGEFICREGPVLRYDRLADRLAVREL